jgi:hypothetical protein
LRGLYQRIGISSQRQLFALCLSPEGSSPAA